jgi:AcrR family transcriptional regulator
MDAAVALCAEVGPKDFSLDLVAKRAGASRTTIYRAFGDRYSLLERALEEAYAELASAPCLSSSDPLEILRGAYAIVSRVTGHEVGRAMLRVLIEEDERELAAKLRSRFYELAYAPYVRLLERARAEGRLAADAEPDELCRIGVAAGLFSVAVLGRPFDLEQAERLARSVALGATPRA